MARTYFKSTPKLTGALLDVSFASKLKNEGGEKEGAVFVKIVKQKTWNEAKKLGGFSGGGSVNVKLNVVEVTDMIRALRDPKHSFKFYHRFEDNPVSGSLNFFEYPPKENKEGTKGFSLKVKKGEDEFKAFLTVAEGWELSAWLEFAREHIYEGICSIDREKFKEESKKKSKLEEVKITENVEEEAQGEIRVPELVVEGPEDEIQW